MGREIDELCIHCLCPGFTADCHRQFIVSANIVLPDLWGWWFTCSDPLGNTYHNHWPANEIVFLLVWWSQYPWWSLSCHLWLGVNLGSISYSLLPSWIHSVLHGCIFWNDVRVHHHRCNNTHRYWGPAPWAVILAQPNALAWWYGVSYVNDYFSPPRHGRCTNFPCRIKPWASDNKR